MVELAVGARRVEREPRTLGVDGEVEAFVEAAAQEVRALGADADGVLPVLELDAGDGQKLAVRARLRGHVAAVERHEQALEIVETVDAQDDVGTRVVHRPAVRRRLGGHPGQADELVDESDGDDRDHGGRDIACPAAE